MISNKNDETTNLKRHQDSFALLNTDIDLYNKFTQERQRIFKLDDLANEVHSLQQDMGDIKKLLQQLVNGKTNG